MRRFSRFKTSGVDFAVVERKAKPFRKQGSKPQVSEVFC
jgi:hypothetical protein